LSIVVCDRFILVIEVIEGSCVKSELEKSFDAHDNIKANHVKDEPLNVVPVNVVVPAPDINVFVANCVVLLNVVCVQSTVHNIPLIAKLSVIATLVNTEALAIIQKRESCPQNTLDILHPINHNGIAHPHPALKKSRNILVVKLHGKNIYRLENCSFLICMFVFPSHRLRDQGLNDPVLSNSDNPVYSGWLNLSSQVISILNFASIHLLTLVVLYAIVKLYSISYTEFVDTAHLCIFLTSHTVTVVVVTVIRETFTQGAIFSKAI
jgi:hypothetical protein